MVDAWNQGDVANFNRWVWIRTSRHHYCAGCALRFPASLQRLILVDTFFSAEMWQANNDNSNRELQNQFPEMWEKIQDARARGYSSCSKESQAVSGAPFSFPLFYDTSNFDKVIAGGGSVNNDVLRDDRRRRRLSDRG